MKTTCDYKHVTDPRLVVTLPILRSISRIAPMATVGIRLRSARFFCSCLSETCRQTCCHKARPRAFTGLILGLSTWRGVILPGKFLTKQGSDLQNASSIMTVRGVWKTVSFMQCTFFPPWPYLAPRHVTCFHFANELCDLHGSERWHSGKTMLLHSVIRLGKPRIVITGYQW